MRRLMVLAVCAAAVVMMERGAAAQDGAKILDDNWIKAVKAGSVDGLVALYAPDAVLYPPDVLEVRGTEAIRKSYTGMLAEMTVTDAKIDSTYTTIGDVSIGWGRFTLTMKPKKGGPPVTMTGRATAVAKRIGGKWLYVSDHASLPLPPPPAPSVSK